MICREEKDDGWVMGYDADQWPKLNLAYSFFVEKERGNSGFRYCVYWDSKNEMKG